MAMRLIIMNMQYKQDSKQGLNLVRGNSSILSGPLTFDKECSEA